MTAAPDEPLNGNLSRRVVVDSAAMPWTPSPSPGVLRKRLHRVGPVESGQVTSIVRYEAGSTFPPHAHPDGEEILVLEGVFCDEHGDWPAGAYLLNPEGFRHAPGSRDGCVLFVKLRQYPGAGRRHVAIDTRQLPWQPGPRTGVSIKPLYDQPGFTDTVRLERWDAGVEPVELCFTQGVEILVLEGDFDDGLGTYRAGTWLRLPVGTVARARTGNGCILYVKEGGFTYLATA